MPPRRKKVAFYLLIGAINLFSFALLEVGIRIYFAIQLGPRVMLYGTGLERTALGAAAGAQKGGERTNVHRHSNNFGDYVPFVPGTAPSYSRYFPNDEKYTRDPDTGERIRVRINSHGLRGDDFKIEKAPNVTRVLTLGASSTFGYSNRDDETYPHYLEEILNQRASAQFEVINFAIPHATSANIVAMFLAEGVQLAPDFVTFYAGANDSAVVERASGLRRFWAEIRRRSLLLEFVSQLVQANFPSAPDTWTGEYADHRSRVFLDNVAVVLDECRKRDIHLILATQQLKSLRIEGGELRGVSYADEVRLVRDESTPGANQRDVWLVDAPAGDWRAVERARTNSALRNLNDPERNLLIHSHIMSRLREFVAEHDVPLVDVIERLDQHRDWLTSWVHLNARANRVVAEAFAEAIAEEVAEVPRSQ